MAPRCDTDIGRQQAERAEWHHIANTPMKPANDESVYRIENLRALEMIASQLERIGDQLEHLNERQGAAANALLQLSDNHGSSTPGPFV